MKPGRPSAILTIDGRRLTAPEAGLMRLRILVSRDCHDTAEIVLWPKSKFVSAKPGSTITISAGVAGDEQDILGGEISAVAQSPDALILEAIASSVKLTRTRKSQAYLNQTVAEIVRDLASGADIDEVQGDLSLPAYNVDASRPVWSHLLELGRLVGADVVCSASGAIRFVPIASGQATRSFRYKADVLSWRLANAAAVTAPKVASYFAASDAGSDKWHWILHDPLNSEPGVVAPAAFTREAADSLGQALKDRVARSAVQGALTLVGEPRLRPGEIIEVKDLPSGAGTFRTLHVRHEISAQAGFITEVAVEGAAAA